MRSSEQGATYAYPHSESQLEEWEGTLLAEGPTTIVKLAFLSLNSLAATPLWRAVKDNDFNQAREALWSRAHAQERFLSSRRHATNNGHRFVRMHAVTSPAAHISPLPHRPPRIDGPYWRALSMAFTHLNGPLAAEETYAIPEAVDRHAGLSYQANEVLVLLSEHGEPRGASTVAYNFARTQINNRTFYEPHHAVTIKAGKVASALLGHPDLQSMRLPVAEPPQAVQEAVGIRALSSLPYKQITSFAGILPPALRQEQNA